MYIESNDSGYETYEEPETYTAWWDIGPTYSLGPSAFVRVAPVC